MIYIASIYEKFSIDHLLMPGKYIINLFFIFTDIISRCNSIINQLFFPESAMMNVVHPIDTEFFYVRIIGFANYIIIFMTIITIQAFFHGL